MKKNQALQNITQNQILKDFHEVRQQTQNIVAPLEIEDYVIQTDFL